MKSRLPCAEDARELIALLDNAVQVTHGFCFGRLRRCFPFPHTQFVLFETTRFGLQMNIRNISANQVVVWCALLLGLLAAIMIGSAVGSSDMRFVAGVIAAIPVAVIFVKLKTNIWVLLPISWYLTGRLPWLPLPFTVRDLCFMAVIFFFTLFFATRALPWKRKLSTLDYLIYLNLAYLATVFVRNPVGVWAMQSSMVGGRPYFEIGLAFGAFMILSRVQISGFIAKIFPLFFVVPTWCVGILDVIGRLIPQTGYVLNSIYSGVGTGGATAAFQAEAELGTTRMSGLAGAGSSSIQALCARYNPITLISPLYPQRVMMLAIAFGAIFLSGFRGLLLFATVAFLLSSILRGRLKDLWIAVSAAMLALVLLVSMQGSVLQLPLTMQRALSWLPGDWNQEAVTDAESSTQWRVEMWGWAWNDDRILRDRVWGQGFGLSIDDMNLIASSLMAGGGGASLLGGSDRENFMITGSFHSGPLSAIKYIGIVGLCFYYPLMCYMAWLAWRLCKRAKGTKAFTLALFVAIPIIYEPFNFVVIFGGLDSNYSQLLFYAGLLNMVQNYIEKITPDPNLLRRVTNNTGKQPELRAA
jgi:hypothetical protein